MSTNKIPETWEAKGGISVEFPLEDEDNLDLPFSVGNRVSYVGEDYRFEGTVIAAFQRLSGEWWYAVEDRRGLLYIESGKNLKISE